MALELEPMPTPRTPACAGNDRSALRQAALVAALRACRLFADLPGPDIERVADIAVPKALRKGETLFREGDPALGFYVLRTGAVAVRRVTPQGREHVIAVFREGDSFAEAAPPGCVYPADAVAVSTAQVLLIRWDGFRDLIAHQPDLALRILGSMSMHLRYLIQRLDDLRFRQVEARLAHWLLKEAERAPGDPQPEIRLAQPKRVLAAELGFAPETLSRAFARFREETLIAVRGPRIRLLNPEGLRRYVEEALREA